MDLIGGYLLIILILFSANAALLIGNYKIDNLKLVVLSFLCAIVAFVLMNISGYLTNPLSFLALNFNYLFLIMAVLVFLAMFYYLKNENVRLAIYSVLIISIILVVSLASQSNLLFFDIILYSLFVFITIFFVYQISKLLFHAKRPYPVIISEYMILSSILLFIFALTYYSTITLDYTMFSSFLILTPTYQLIYVIIGIIVVMVIGVLLNDYGGK